MNNYLIPANSKKGQLILGLFRPFDLILFGCGIGITIILFSFISTTNIWGTLLILSPALVSGFLVMPVPHYHNAMTVISEGLTFINSRQKYIWKGWCLGNGDKNK
ncbi:MAG: hypothetical protein RSB99_02690 [Bacilli bacterium]